MRGLWRQNPRTVLVTRVGPLLAQRLSQVFVLCGDVSRFRYFVFYQRRDDIVQAGLYEVSLLDVILAHSLRPIYTVDFF